MFNAWTTTTPGSSWNWSAVAPADMPMPLRLPELPSDLAAYAPSVDATAGLPTILYGDSSAVSGYRQYITIFGAVLPFSTPSAISESYRMSTSEWGL